MVGWSFKSPAIIREFADYIIKGSHIDVLLKNPTQNQVDEIKALEQSKTENNGVTLIPEKNTTYELEADDCFVVLAEDELQPDRLQFRMTFILSAVALFLGPFLYALGQKTPTARQILDGFIFITIAGIVCVDIIPQSISKGGVYAFAFLVLGLVFPVVLEKNFRKAVPHAHEVVLLLAAIGLILHAAIDGIALLPLDDSRSVFDNKLAIGVILHRLPVGMALWWSVRPQFGTAVAVAVFAVIIGATAAAYFLGAPVVEVAATASVAWFQAFVAGSLVHIIAFGVSHDHDAHIEVDPTKSSWGYRAGVLLGLFLIFNLPLH